MGWSGWARALGLARADLRSDLPIELVDNGMKTAVIPLVSAEAVGAARPEIVRLAEWASGRAACVLVFALTGSGGAGAPDLVCRVFGPDDLLPEDAAAGSANGPLGHYLIRHGVLPGPVVESEQGTAMGRRSRLTIEVAADAVFVGGQVWRVGSGEFHVNR